MPFEEHARWYRQAFPGRYAVLREIGRAFRRVEHQWPVAFCPETAELVRLLLPGVELLVGGVRARQAHLGGAQALANHAWAYDAVAGAHVDLAACQFRQLEGVELLVCRAPAALELPPAMAEAGYALRGRPAAQAAVHVEHALVLRVIAASRLLTRLHAAGGDGGGGGPGVGPGSPCKRRR